MYTVLVKYWYQRVYGNTYHSVTLTAPGEEPVYSGVVYGQPEAWAGTARQALVDAGKLPATASIAQVWAITDKPTVIPVLRKRDLYG